MMLSERTKTTLRWVVGIGLLAYIVSQLSLESLAQYFVTLAILPMLLSLLAKFGLRVLVAAKWYFLVRVSDPTFRFVDALAMHFIGGAAGIALPLVGVDAVVGYAYYRHRGQAGTAISTVIVDRVIGVYTTVILATVGVLFNLERFSGMPGILWFVGVLVAGALIGPFVLHGLASSGALWRRVRLPERITRLGKEIVTGFRDLRDYGVSMLVLNVALSFATQLVRVIAAFALAFAVHEQPSFLDFMVLIPLSFLIAMVPLTVGGLGIEQGAFIVLFGLVGISAESAFVMSIVGTALTTVSVLPGVVLIMRGWGTAAAEIRIKGKENPPAWP